MTLLGLNVCSRLNYDLGYNNESLPMGEASEYTFQKRTHYRVCTHNTKSNKLTNKTTRTNTHKEPKQTNKINKNKYLNQTRQNQEKRIGKQKQNKQTKTQPKPN